MSYPIRAILAAIAIAAPLSLARAQTAPAQPPADQEHAAHHPETTGAPTAPMPAPAAMPGMEMGKMMRGDMGEMMRTMHGGMMPAQPDGMMPFHHVEGRIAFLKAELAITDAQLPQWNTFAEAVRAGAKSMHASMADIMQTGMPATAPARADTMVQMMSAHLDAMKAIIAAAKPLYAVLSTDQKKTADELVMEHMHGMMRMTGMGPH